MKPASRRGSQRNVRGLMALVTAHMGLRRELSDGAGLSAFSTACALRRSASQHRSPSPIHAHAQTVDPPTESSSSDQQLFQFSGLQRQNTHHLPTHSAAEIYFTTNHLFVLCSASIFVFLGH